MAKYLMGAKEGKPINVSRSPITYMVDFDFPEDVKESYSYVYLAERTGKLPMMFYSTPQIGSVIEYMGHEWQVTGERHYPTKRYSRTPKTIPLIYVKYLGATEAEKAFLDE